MARLGDICEIVSGTTPKSNIPEYWDGDINWVTPAELNDETTIIYESQRKITKQAVEDSSLKSFPAGTVLLSSRAPIGKVAIAGVEMYCNQGFKNLICSDKIHNKYLFWFLKDRTDYLNSLGRGATFKEISKSIVENIEIPLPPIKEQKQYATTLDKFSGLISLRKQQLDRLDELVKARFVEMFGTLTTTKFSVKTLNELCLFIKDGTHQTPTYTEDSENGIKFLSSKDVTSGQIDWTKIKYIPQDLHEELYARIAPQRGDILLAKNGTTGIPAIVDTDDVFDIYVSLALLRFKDGNNITYLWAALSTLETKRQFDSSLKGIGVPNLHLSEIKKAKIIVPPIELQNKFSSFVEKIKRQKLTIQQSLDKLEVLKKSLMQEYFG